MTTEPVRDSFSKEQTILICQEQTILIAAKATRRVCYDRVAKLSAPAPWILGSRRVGKFIRFTDHSSIVGIA